MMCTPEFRNAKFAQAVFQRLVRFIAVIVNVEAGDHESRTAGAGIRACPLSVIGEGPRVDEGRLDAATIDERTQGFVAFAVD